MSLNVPTIPTSTLKPIVYLSFLLVIPFFSCNPEPSFPEKVIAALETSGKNAKELRKVLVHFLENPADSLRYEAACYLISNMPGHRSSFYYQGVPGPVEEAFRSMDSLVNMCYFSPYISDTNDETEARHRAFSGIVSNRLLLQQYNITQHEGIYPDLENIKAEWLIDHIDNAFGVWENAAPARWLSFSEFKEIILPYRYRIEMLDLRSSEYKSSFFNMLMPHATDVNLGTMVDKINTYTSGMSCLKKTDRMLGKLGPYDLLQFNALGCDRHSEWTARVLNACGIPAVYDFTPLWRNRDRNHFWVAVRDSMGVYHPFTPMWQSLHDTIYFKETSKVFRLTYEKQPSPGNFRGNGEKIPPVFKNPYLKDVTDQYHRVVNLTVPVKLPVHQNEFTYLAIFGASGWRPIGWGQYDRDRKNVLFEKVPTSVLYVAGKSVGENVSPETDPFYVDEKGKIISVVPDPIKRINVTVKRKFHEKGHLIDMMEKMIGARIMGANQPDFSDAELLHTLSQMDLADMKAKAIPMRSGKSYRYLRCVPDSSEKLNLAGFRVFAKRNKQAEEVFYRPLADTVSYHMIKDEDPETFVTVRSLEIDLGEQLNLNAIEVTPRNSNNAVTPGDHYELYYFDKKWVSAGVIKASGPSVTFSAVPSGTLYWLRNLDRGKEEQAFLYDGKRQIFINEDNYIDYEWIPFSESIRYLYN